MIITELLAHKIEVVFRQVLFAHVNVSLSLLIELL